MHKMRDARLWFHYYVQLIKTNNLHEKWGLIVASSDNYEVTSVVSPIEQIYSNIVLQVTMYMWLYEI